MLTPLRVFAVLAPVCFCFTTLDFFSLSYQTNILWFSLISSHVIKKRLKPRETKTNVTFVTDHIDIICTLFSSCLTFSFVKITWQTLSRAHLLRLAAKSARRSTAITRWSHECCYCYEEKENYLQEDIVWFYTKFSEIRLQGIYQKQ